MLALVEGSQLAQGRGALGTPTHAGGFQALKGVDLENEDALFDNVDYRGAYQALWQR